MALFTESADVSVRPSLPEDADHVVRVQVEAWRAAHGDALGDDALAALDVEQMRERWETAIASPPGRDFAVLVACERADVVGFVAVAPGQVVALEVLPTAQRSGHGSRLLAAAVDRLRADGADDLTTWVLEGDTAREAFFAGAGLAEDGRTRVLDVAGRPVAERRWSASLAR